MVSVLAYDTLRSVLMEGCSWFGNCGDNTGLTSHDAPSWNPVIAIESVGKGKQNTELG